MKTINELSLEEAAEVKKRISAWGGLGLVSIPVVLLIVAILWVLWLPWTVWVFAGIYVVSAFVFFVVCSAADDAIDDHVRALRLSNRSEH